MHAASYADIVRSRSASHSGERSSEVTKYKRWWETSPMFIQVSILLRSTAPPGIKIIHSGGYEARFVRIFGHNVPKIATLKTIQELALECSP